MARNQAPSDLPEREYLHMQNMEGKFSDKNYIYNGFSFVYTDDLWYTRMQEMGKIMDIPFHFSPKEAEDVVVNGDIIDYLVNLEDDMLYILFDPDEDNLTYDWHFKIFDNEEDGSSLRRTFTVPGKKEITVTVSDGKEVVEHTFKAEVYQKIEEEKEPEEVVKKVVKKTTVQQKTVQQPVQRSKPKIVAYVIEHEEPKDDSEITVVTL